MAECEMCGAPVQRVEGGTGIKYSPGPPPASMAQAARERAQEAADERGIGIERICIAQSPDGKEMHVFVLGDEPEGR